MWISLSRIFAVVFISAALIGCESVDDDRIPPSPVSITFSTIGEWELYGVSGAGQYRRFIFTDSEREPAGYPYKGLDRTGFGGVLLLADPNGQYIVYDLACPVEVRSDVRIYVDVDNELAGVGRCPQCGSTYNLYVGGQPMGGEALSKSYGLQRYKVNMSGGVGNYASITR